MLDADEVEGALVVTVTTTSTYTDDVTDTYYITFTAGDVGNAVIGIEIDGGNIIF